MKRNVIALLIIMFTKIISFSAIISNQDSTIQITHKQLKQANLIFIEHKKLINENDLLLKQLNNYECLNNNLIQIDSVKTIQLNKCKDLNNDYKRVIDNLNEDIKSKENSIKAWKIGCFSFGLGLILFAMFK